MPTSTTEAGGQARRGGEGRGARGAGTRTGTHARTRTHRDRVRTPPHSFGFLPAPSITALATAAARRSTFPSLSLASLKRSACCLPPSQKEREHTHRKAGRQSGREHDDCTALHCTTIHPSIHPIHHGTTTTPPARCIKPNPVPLPPPSLLPSPSSPPHPIPPCFPPSSPPLPSIWLESRLVSLQIIYLPSQSQTFDWYVVTTA